MCRTAFTVLLAAIALVGSISGSPRDAVAQDAVAQEDVASRGSFDRGPRFFYAPPGSGAMVPVDASAVVMLRRRVSLDFDGVSLGTVLDEIAQQAGVRLNYSRSLLRLDAPVSIHARRLTVAAALTEVLLDAGVDVVVMSSGQVSLRKHVQRQVGAIVGTVTDAKTAEPIEAAMIEVRGTKLNALTGEDGRYRIANVPDGSYTLTARRLGYDQVMQSVTVKAERESVVDFALKKAPTALEQVVVTGTIVPTEVKALPTPISVVTDSQIAQRHPFSLGDIMRQAVPSAVSFNPPNVPDNTEVSVRGTTSLIHAGALKIFIDGLEASTFDLTPIDPSSIERIEVIRGPEAATIYGSDAATGVMQIFTKRGDSTDVRPHLDAQVALGLAQTPYEGYGAVLRQQYTATMHGGGPGVSYSIGGGYTHLGDYVPDNGPTHESVPSVQGGIRFARGIASVDLFGRFHATRAPLSINPVIRTSGYVPESRPDKLAITTNNEAYGTRAVVSPRSWWRNQLTLGIDRAAVKDVQWGPKLTTPADTLMEVLDETIRKISVGYNTSISGAMRPGLTGALTVGLDHYARGVTEFLTTSAVTTAGTITTSPPGAVTEKITSVANTGYFAQGQIGIRDALFFTAGVRAEHNSNFGKDFGTAVLPRFGVSYARPVGGTMLKLRAAYGRALRTPNPGEAAGSVLPTSIQLANPSLGPEEQRGWDAGVDLAFGSRASLSVTGYDQTAIGLIAFLQVASIPVPTYK